jgi:tellurite resistance protein TerC
LVDALLQAAPWWAWAGFHAFVFLMLALDLGVFNRRVHAPTMREAGIWSAVWIGLALVFNGLIFQAEGPQKGLEWLTGYVLEKSLSVDNLFVFVLIFQSFRVDLRHQHRLLFWGVLGALILRAAMILVGTVLLNRFEWMVFVFGGFLLYTGLKMLLVHEEVAADPSQNRLARAFQQFLPFDETGGHERFWVKRAGSRLATPMLLVLLTIEMTDLIFAVDSIPAVLAVSRDPFVVYTSNIFAVLGLRSLYFVLAKMIDRFHRLKTGLAVVLAFVGVKMCIAQWLPIPAVLAGSVIASLAWPAEQEGP